MRVGCSVDEVSYCSSKYSPDLEAVGVVTDLVVVRVSKTNAANDNFLDRGVDECANSDESKCDLMVVLPVPDSPLFECQQHVVCYWLERGELNEGPVLPHKELSCSARAPCGEGRSQRRSLAT